MSTLKKTIYDALTGETITRDFTSDEITELEKNVKDAEVLAAAQIKNESDKATKRAAVMTRLGLTSDELLALLS